MGGVTERCSCTFDPLTGTISEMGHSGQKRAAESDSSRGVLRSPIISASWDKEREVWCIAEDRS